MTVAKRIAVRYGLNKYKDILQTDREQNSAFTVLGVDLKI